VDRRSVWRCRLDGCSAWRRRLVPRKRTAAPGQPLIPFALSLSKGASTKVFQQGFDRLSPNGKKPFALSLSKGASTKVFQ
jgi:hypothetical protein